MTYPASAWTSCLTTWKVSELGCEAPSAQAAYNTTAEMKLEDEEMS